MYARTIASLLLSVFTTRVILEALGESDFGLYNVVGGAVSMLGFVSASLSSTTQRFLSYAEGEGNSAKIKQYFNNAIIIHRGLAALMSAVFLVAGIVLFNGVFNVPDGKLNAAIVVYLSLIVSTVFSITIVPYNAEINAHEDMLVFSILGISDVLAKFVIAQCVLHVDSDRLAFYAILMAVESLILRYATQYYCRIHYTECREISLKAYYNRTIIKEITSFAGWNMANITTGMISLFGMNLVINHYFGTTVNAAMGIATQLSGVMMGLSANMLKAVTPVIVKSEGSNQHQLMLEYTYASCKFSYLIFSFVCIPVLFFITPILHSWLITVPQWTSTLCILLVVSTLIEQLSVVLYHSIMAVGKIKHYNIAKSITNISPIIISIIMFRTGNFPPYWVYINWGICKSFMGGMVNLYFSKHLIGMSYRVYFSKVVRPVFSTTMASSFAICICQFSLVNLPWWFGTGAAFVVSIPVYFFLSLNKSEQSKLISFIK